MNPPTASHSNPAFRLILTVLVGALVIILPLSTAAAADNGTRHATGSIAGTVLDAADNTPLKGATVEIRPQGRKVQTGADGHFTIGTLAPGWYTLVVTYVGYSPDTLLNVEVRGGDTTPAHARLHPLAVEGGTIIVTGAVDPLPPQGGAGTVPITADQIRSRPGTLGDISRMVAGTPTVARFDDRYASLVVRGGSPMENGYYIDKIPVPSISHFPSQGNAGGPLGLLNSSIIKGATFYTGGFPVAYGDRMSSVLDISLRDGDRQRFSGEGALAVTGATVSVEGPIRDGRGSYLMCGRHSFLNLVRKAIDMDAVPNYDDIYAKVSFSHDSLSSYEMIGLLGAGNFLIDESISQSSGFNFYGDLNYTSGSLGFAWDRRWPGKGDANVSFAFSSLRWTNNNRFSGTDQMLYDNNSRENTFTVRNVNSRRLGSFMTAGFGAEFHYIDARYDYTLGQYSHETGYPNPAVSVSAVPDFMTGALWLDNEMRFGDRLTVTAGVRADAIGYSAHSHLAPRGSIRLRLSRNASIYTAAGLYYQSLPLTIVLQHRSNQRLRDPRALNLVAGAGCRPTGWLGLNLESYFKRYDHMPMDTTQANVFVLDELVYNYGFVAGHLPLVDSGRSDVYGLETTVTFRPSDHLFCRIGTAWSRAKFLGVDNAWYDRVIDNRFAADIELTLRPTAGWTFSSRWLFGGGRPYTPFNMELSRLHNDGVYDLDQANKVRFPDYHSLSLRIERRFSFGRSDVALYGEVWNVYNRENVSGQYWDPNTRRVEAVNQFPRLPIVGLEYRF